MPWSAGRPALWIVIILIGNSFLFTNNGKASAEDSTIQLTVASIDIEGHDVIGKYVELRLKAAFVTSGFTPVTFVISNATEYQVGIADFRQYLFDHWLDTGSTDRWRSIEISEDTEIVAVYRIDKESATQSSSSAGGGGGGSRNKSVMILAPGEGEQVNPLRIGVSGVTVGNPVSVEIAVRNPITDISTPYETVTPRSPGDFTWWSHSFEVNDLTMTEIVVRALFLDDSQQSDSVGIFYSTGGSTSVRSGITTRDNSGTSINILDSIRIAEADTMLANKSEISVPADISEDSEVPDEIETTVNQSSSEATFTIIFPLLLVLAVAALLTWLVLRKRQELTRQFKKA